MTTRLGVVALTLVMALALAQPAQGATTPATVGLPSFVRASLTGPHAALVLTWPAAARATKYQVFMSTNYDRMSKAPVRATTKRTIVAIGKLRPGTSYFFQVRALNGSKAGAKSSRVGHTTIRAQGRAAGPKYKVLTYNLCSAVASCDREPHTWTSREAAAVRKITAINADVIAVQESKNLDPVDLPAYTEAISKSSKRLLYRTDRFNLVRADFINMRSDKYAVWAELEDKSTGQHVIFTSVHTTQGKANAEAQFRKIEIVALIKGLRTINTDSLPVVLAGDFNSHKNRANDWIAGPLHANKFYDAYDLAMSFRRQHFNSYSQPDHEDDDPWVTAAMTSKKWGDHVDHMWVDPATTRVLSWRNDASFSGSRLVEPIPSDHNPLSFVVQIN